ncbi:hypothetical protein JY96_03775 [Aquabacterium sp. NJ1]|uniref:PP0621 family protein n=1 Tax=Aquabacterium sp. NJ1 TaxID=1538295 RepID=UPI00052BD034|nr:PP0621 family protein [Aquabacterium sp. NJ1]KGM39437.1 hypothetical protein JY96_03775 [Aquabacterium sp. NJ1]
MFKYLLIALLLVWLFYSPALRGRRTGSKPPGKPEAPRAEKMVQCAHCGVHLPEGEAVMDDKGQAFCSQAHRHAGRGQA